MESESHEQGNFDTPACPAGAERELCLLFGLTEALDQELDPEGLHEVVLRHLASMMNADGGLLFLTNSHGEPAVMSRWNMDDEEVGKKVLSNLDFNSQASGFRRLTGEDPLGKVLSTTAKDKHWCAFFLNEGRGVKGLVLLFRSDQAGYELFSERFTAYVIRTVSRAIEHTRMAKLVQESEQRYRRIFERLKDTLYETTKEGKFVDINQAGVDLFRFDSREEILHLNSIASLYAKPQDRSSFIKAIEKNGFVKDYETTMVTKYGDPVEVSITSNVRRGKAGEVLGYEGIIRDITPYKQLWQKLSESEAKYRDMVENSNDGIGIYSDRGFLYVNRAFCEMFGYQEANELRNTDLLQVIADESRQSILNHIRMYMKSPAQYRMFEGMGLRKDGTVFSVEVRAFPTVFQEQRAHQMTFRDITGKKKMEEQLIQSERLAATGKLAMDIAHEINNPLGGIITYTHLVLEDLPDGSIQKQNVEKILKLANRCKIIVKGLLDFARDDSDIKEPVDVNDLIRETLYLIQGHVIMNKVKLTLDLDENLPRLWAVRVKLEQVFLNLVVNAAEAMEGQGALSIATEYVRSKNIVRVQFSDTGHGVDPEHLKKVFEPFFTTKKRGRGTGLGLSISHGIIKQHNGAIYAESLPEDGSTFIIELPV